MPALLDLTGQRFGRLLVIERASDHRKPNGARVRQWRVRCDCGAVKKVRGDHLRSGDTRSCGCLQRENVGALGARNWKGGRRITAAGYVQVRVGRGYVSEHRVVMAELVGRPLTDAEVVHHVDAAAKADNRPANLWLFPSAGAHSSWHEWLAGHRSEPPAMPAVELGSAHPACRERLDVAA